MISDIAVAWRTMNFNWCKCGLDNLSSSVFDL